jgi:hypothetical protein
MAFVKPYTYVDGTTLTADNQHSNEEAAKVYVNQEIIPADIGTDFKFDEIEAGEFMPITGDHKFASSFIAGQCTTAGIRDRAYFTSTTKSNTQTAASSVVYRDLFGCGKQVILDKQAAVVITFQAAFIGNDNSTTSGGDGKGKWENKVLLRHTDYTQDNPTPDYISGTRGYVFEPSGTSSGVLDPNQGGNAAGRRQVMFQFAFTSLSKGKHDFNVAINPKIESGWTSARNFVVEVFYL